jgi:hypothetical protein
MPTKSGGSGRSGCHGGIAKALSHGIASTNSSSDTLYRQPGLSIATLL